MTALELICEEREKQKKKYSLEHDKKHAQFELVYEAVLLSLGLEDYWKLHMANETKLLTIAGALLIAQSEVLGNKISIVTLPGRYGNEPFGLAIYNALIHFTTDTDKQAWINILFTLILIRLRALCNT
jgi:hypothetical protein